MHCDLTLHIDNTPCIAVLLPTVVVAIMVEELPGSLTACVPSVTLSTTSDALVFFSAVYVVSAASHSNLAPDITQATNKLVSMCHLKDKAKMLSQKLHDARHLMSSTMPKTSFYFTCSYGSLEIFCC